MKKMILFLLAIFFSGFVSAQERKISEIQVSQLPKGVSNYVNQTLPGSKIMQAAKVVENASTSYIALVNVNGKNHAYLFDSNGKFKGKPDPGLIKEAKLKMTGQQPKTKADPSTKPPVQPSTTTTVKQVPTTPQTGKAVPATQPAKPVAKPATPPPPKSDAETVPAKTAATDEVPKK